MFNFKSFVQQAILACALVVGASPAFAGPVYHVSINTAAITEPTGIMTFDFLGMDVVDVATATLTNFSGAFGAEESRGPAVTDIAGGYTFASGFEGYLTRAVTLGGMFGFDITFADGFSGNDGATFGIALYKSDYSGYLGLEGNLVSFELVPAMGGQPSLLTVSDDNAFASVTEVRGEVPEPSDLLLMLTALAMAGFVTRRARAQVK